MEEPGEENGCPPQCSCLESPTDGGAWRAAVSAVTKSQTWMRDERFHFFLMLNLLLF